VISFFIVVTGQKIWRRKFQEIVPTVIGSADVTYSFSFFWRILIFHFYFGDQAIFIEFIVVRPNTNRFKFFIEIVKTRVDWFYIFLTEYGNINLLYRPLFKEILSLMALGTNGCYDGAQMQSLFPLTYYCTWLNRKILAKRIVTHCIV